MTRTGLWSRRKIIVDPRPNCIRCSPAQAHKRMFDDGLSKGDEDEGDGIEVEQTTIIEFH
jgi:hypothetical protein